VEADTRHNQVYVRVDPGQSNWWWVFMRLRYAFMFSTVFVVTAIYMLSIQSQLLLWVFYYSTKYDIFHNTGDTGGTLAAGVKGGLHLDGADILSEGTDLPGVDELPTGEMVRVHPPLRSLPHTVMQGKGEG
jgi:hypothetical protein